MRVFAWIMISVLFVACGDGPEELDGGDEERDASSADGGADSGSDDASTGDAGVLDAGTTDAGTTDAGTLDAGPIEVRQATVSLTQYRGLASPMHVVYGGFYPELRAPTEVEESGVPCTASATSGACGLYECTLGTRAGAGVLTAAVDGTTIATVEQAPSGDHAFSADGIVAEPGDVVTFSATGDEVPAFSGEVTMTGAVTTTLPTSVPRDTALTLTWSTSAPADRAQIVIAGGTESIACIVDGAVGTVTVAPELLGMLAAGTGFVGMTAFNFVAVTAGEYRVLLTAADAVGAAVTLE